MEREGKGEGGGEGRGVGRRGKEGKKMEMVFF